MFSYCPLDSFFCSKSFVSDHKQEILSLAEDESKRYYNTSFNKLSKKAKNKILLLVTQLCYNGEIDLDYAVNVDESLFENPQYQDILLEIKKLLNER